MASLNKVMRAPSWQAARDVAQARHTWRIAIGLLIFPVLFGMLGSFASASSRESEVSFRFDRLNVASLLLYVPGKLPVTVQTGKLSANLKLHFMMSDNAPTLRVQARSI